jgi:C1A family cysteine protease
MTTFGECVKLTSIFAYFLQAFHIGIKEVINMVEHEEETGERMTFGMGWLPDYPDFRDYTEDTEEIKGMLQKTSVKSHKEAGSVSFPTSTDLRPWCSPIEDQGSLGSCTAQAGVGLMEYLQRRAFGIHTDASRLFLYKTTRSLLHWTGDTGAFLRSTMGAMVLFGVPPEEYWPYTTKKPTGTTIPEFHFDVEPPAFCYSFAKEYQPIKYLRLDPPGISRNALLSRIKAYLNSGLPSMFGFTVFNSIGYSRVSGKIKFPCPRERILGGHAVVAVGYDDNKKIVNPICPKAETTGALLIRNSWGTDWGEKGYGWLPYDYILRGAASDFWVLLSQKWVETEQFK